MHESSRARYARKAGRTISVRCLRSLEGVLDGFSQHQPMGGVAGEFKSVGWRETRQSDRVQSGLLGTERAGTTPGGCWARSQGGGEGEKGGAGMSGRSDAGTGPRYSDREPAEPARARRTGSRRLARTVDDPLDSLPQPSIESVSCLPNTEAKDSTQRSRRDPGPERDACQHDMSSEELGPCLRGDA